MGAIMVAILLIVFFVVFIAKRNKNSADKGTELVDLKPRRF